MFKQRIDNLPINEFVANAINSLMESTESTEARILLCYEESTTKQDEPKAIGLLIPLKNLDEIKKATIHNLTKEGEERTGQTHLYCLLFKSYSFQNLKRIIQLYGNNAVLASCYYYDGHRVRSPYELSETMQDTWNPLHIICSCYSYGDGHMKDIIRLLINKHGFDPNAMAANGNAFHMLCRYYRGENLKEMIDFLIDECKCIATATTTDGMNAIHLLCMYYTGKNLKEMIDFLISKGIDPAAKTNDGWNPFQMVCRYYRDDDLQDIMGFLISKGNDTTSEPNVYLLLSAFYNEGELFNLLSFLINTIGSKKISATDDKGWNALHHLCCSYVGPKFKEIVHLLCDNGIDVNALTKHGHNALLLLCQCHKGKDFKEIIETLIARGIKLDVTIINFNVLSLIATKNYYHKDLGDIIELLCENREIHKARYDPIALIYICFVYRGPEPELERIVNHIIKVAEKSYDSKDLIEDLKSGLLLLTLFNSNLERSRIKEYILQCIRLGAIPRTMTLGRDFIEKKLNLDCNLVAALIYKPSSKA